MDAISLFTLSAIKLRLFSYCAQTGNMSGVHKLHNMQLASATPPRSPRPPPVPNRPVSYTPSGADSLNTLNNCNLDSVRNYGSAADDLEIDTIRQPIEIPEFMKIADVEKFSPKVGRSLPPPPENEEPYQQAWNRNIVENYPDGEWGGMKWDFQKLL